MPIPGPGTAISIQTIVDEFGGTSPHSLSEYYRGGGLVPNTPTNSAIPTGGQIAMNNFYGSANRNIVILTIGSNTQNYDVYDNRGPTYTPGSSDITLTVESGVIVGSSSTPAYAMLIPSAFNPGDTVTIINNGSIMGTGADAGAGGAVNSPGVPGSVGGNAIFANRPTTIINNNFVAGGGGGGGGGGASTQSRFNAQSGGGGGGGGGGNNGGSGGAGGAVQFAGSAGSPGTPSGGGAGGSGNQDSPARLGGPGGAGGGLGSNGINGTPGSGGVSNTGGGAGGGGGNYIVGNPFVTWPVTGTRLGGVA